VSAFINMGAQFLTEPLDRKAELRCYLRDPDGYLVEVGRPPTCWRACSPTHRPATSADASRN
jgi:hypothetical protein